MTRHVCVACAFGLLIALLASCDNKAELTELRTKGKQAFVEEDYASARKYLLEGLTQAPSDKELLYFAAQAYRRDYLYDSALFYFKRIDVLYPGDRETNLQIHEIAMNLEQWEDVISSIGVLAKTGDGYEPYLGELSDLWARTGSYINALYWARRAIAVRPDNAIAYQKAASAAAMCDSMATAMQLVDTALAMFGPLPRLRANKATFLNQLGNHKEAEKMLRELIAEDTTVPGYRLGLAHSLAAQGSNSQKREALELYRSLKGLLPPEFAVDSLAEVLEKELK